jgi:hypothetical protein
MKYDLLQMGAQGRYTICRPVLAGSGPAAYEYDYLCR